MEASGVRGARFWAGTESDVFAPPRLEAEGEKIRALLAGESAVVFASSGSGGVPKWILFRRDALLLSAQAVNRHLEVTADDRWLLALPLFHVGGFGVVARAYAADCGIHCLAGRWDAMRFGDEVERQGSTLASLVPTQVHDLVACGVRAPESLRAVVVGGARLEEVTGEAARALGWPIMQSYGMTEAASQVATASLESLKQEFCAAPLPILKMWEHRVGENGCLQLRGDALAHCYVHRENGQLNRELLCDGEGWFPTTDRVEIENDNLTVLGRADRRVKVLGELVEVQELEEEVRAHLSPEAGVHILLVPDERRGWRLLPIIAQGGRGVEEVIALVNDRRPGFSRMERPQIVEHLPRTALGKIDAAALSEEFGVR